MMSEFSDALNRYFQKTSSTAQDLSTVSGISASTISRYRTGERVPKDERLSTFIDALCQLVIEKEVDGYREEDVRRDFAPFTDRLQVDYDVFVDNLNTLIEKLDIRASTLARSLRFDSSYLSRIRTKKRRPADVDSFVTDLTQYVIRNYSVKEIAEAIDCSMGDLSTGRQQFDRICFWLKNRHEQPQDCLELLLHEIDRFNIDEFVSVMHSFEQEDITVQPAQVLPKTYYGYKAMKQGELDFFHTTILSGSHESVFMCNSIPIDDLRKDSGYMQQWMTLVAKMIMDGVDLHIIHDIDRPYKEMMLGLISWIPLYMTGHIFSYYLEGNNNLIYCHTDYVSGETALSGECLRGYHKEGKYYLTQEKQELEYYHKRASRLLSKAQPLMRTYRAEQSEAYQTFENTASLLDGERHYILSSLPLHTMPDEVLEDIFRLHDFTAEERTLVLADRVRQRYILQTMLKSNNIVVDIPYFSEEDFQQHPLSVPFRSLPMKKIPNYSYEQYETHLRATQELADQYPTYQLNCMPLSPFKNIEICIHSGKWVVVSKNNAPEIHFVIHHPKMLQAFEHFQFPITNE